MVETGSDLVILKRNSYSQETLQAEKCIKGGSVDYFNPAIA